VPGGTELTEKTIWEPEDRWELQPGNEPHFKLPCISCDPHALPSVKVIDPDAVEPELATFTSNVTHSPT